MARPLASLYRPAGYGYDKKRPLNDDPDYIRGETDRSARRAQPVAVYDPEAGFGAPSAPGSRGDQLGGPPDMKTGVAQATFGPGTASYVRRQQRQGQSDRSLDRSNQYAANEAAGKQQIFNTNMQRRGAAAEQQTANYELADARRTAIDKAALAQSRSGPQAVNTGKFYPVVPVNGLPMAGTAATAGAASPPAPAASPFSGGDGSTTLHTEGGPLTYNPTAGGQGVLMNKPSLQATLPAPGAPGAPGVPGVGFDTTLAGSTSPTFSFNTAPAGTPGTAAGAPPAYPVAAQATPVPAYTRQSEDDRLRASVGGQYPMQDRDAIQGRLNTLATLPTQYAGNPQAYVDVQQANARMAADRAAQDARLRAPLAAAPFTPAQPVVAGQPGASLEQRLTATLGPDDPAFQRMQALEREREQRPSLAQKQAQDEQRRFEQDIAMTKAANPPDIRGTGSQLSEKENRRRGMIAIIKTGTGRDRNGRTAYTPEAQQIRARLAAEYLAELDAEVAEAPAETPDQPTAKSDEAGNYETPTKASIDKAKSDPSLKDAFEKRFGPGSWAKYTNG